MDELQWWQMEERGRQLQMHRAFLETPGAFDSIKLAAKLAADPDWRESERKTREALKATVNASVIDAIRNTIAAIDYQNTAPPLGWRFQATYVEVIRSLSAVHETLKGVGAILCITWGAVENDEIAPTERQFELPATVWPEQEPPDSEVETLDRTGGRIATKTPTTLDDIDAAILKNTPNTSSADASLSTPSGSLDTPQIWTIERSENPKDVHHVILRAVGEKAGKVVDWMTMALQSSMRGDSKALNLALRGLRQVVGPPTSEDDVETFHLPEATRSDQSSGGSVAVDILPDLRMQQPFDQHRDVTQMDPLQDRAEAGDEDNFRTAPWVNNSYEMEQWSELGIFEFWEKMRALGKVVVFRGRHSLDSPVTLFGFTEEDLNNAYYGKLTVRDFLVAIEEVYSACELLYEHEKGETYHKYWVLDGNRQRAVSVSITSISGTEDSTRSSFSFGGGFSRYLAFTDDDTKIMAWRDVLFELQTQIDHKLVFRAAHIVEQEQRATVSTVPMGIAADDVSRETVRLLKPLSSESPTSIRDPFPWENIPDYRWDRDAVRGLWEGLTSKEIADRLSSGLNAKTVTNRLSVLRKQYPKYVPIRDHLKQRHLEKWKLG